MRANFCPRLRPIRMLKQPGGGNQGISAAVDKTRRIMNHIKTFMLMAALTAVAVGVGYLAGGYTGLYIALAIAGVMNFVGYWWSDKIVLKLYKAREVGPDEAPQLYEMVADLARRGNVPMPKVCIIPSATPNAFATGRNPRNAAVAITEGLLNMLEPEEVKAVMAHEMAHVINRDTLIGTIAATFAGAISMLAHIMMWTSLMGGRNNNNPIGAIGMIVAIIFAPLAASMIQMAISRSREYLADRTGAELMGSGRELASALQKLHYGAQQVPFEREPEPATAHMFIVNPLSRKGMGALFSTHPPMEMRVQKLMEWKPAMQRKYS
jgi:heat shock protein HtpX